MIRIKPKIVEVTLGDKRAEKIKDILKLIEPLQKFKALHKARKPLQDILGVELEPKRVWFWVYHDSDRYGNELRHFCEYRYWKDGSFDGKLDDVAELYRWMEKELERETRTREIIVYDAKLWEFLRDTISSYEMRASEFEAKRLILINKLRTALDVMEKLTVDGVELPE